MDYSNRRMSRLAVLKGLPVVMLRELFYAHSLISYKNGIAVENDFQFQEPEAVVKD